MNPSMTAAPGTRRDLSFLDVLTVMLRHRRLIIGLPLVLTLVVVALTLAQRRQFTSRATFMPQAGDASRLASLGGLAAQFGVNIPTTDQGQSPEFYADMVLSRPVLGSLLDTAYTFKDPAGAPRSGTYAALMEIEGDSPALRREAALRDLQNRVGVSRNLRTGVIELRVRTPWPELSAQMATRILAKLNEFNVRQRHERAAAEREFAESRLREIRAELREAEDAVVRFERSNRAFARSPDASAQHARLEREVGIRQQMFMSFSQMYEQARVDAVRNTPLITVLEQPTVPALPDSRRGLLRVLLSLIAGTLVALFIAFVRELASPHRAHSETAFAEFEALRRDAIRNPLGGGARRGRTHA